MDPEIVYQRELLAETMRVARALDRAHHIGHEAAAGHLEAVRIADERTGERDAARREIDILRRQLGEADRRIAEADMRAEAADRRTESMARRAAIADSRVEDTNRRILDTTREREVARFEANSLRQRRDELEMECVDLRERLLRRETRLRQEGVTLSDSDDEQHGAVSPDLGAGSSRALEATYDDEEEEEPLEETRDEDG